MASPSALEPAAGAVPGDAAATAAPFLAAGGAAGRASAPFASRGPLRPGVLRALLRHGSGTAGLIGLVLMALVAVAGPRFLAYEPNAVNVVEKLAPASAAHPLGTDYLGRDVLSRTVEAAHRSLGTALVIVVCVLSISVAVGALAGFAGGLIDAAIMRIVDVQLALPSLVLALVLALVLVGTLGPRLSTLILSLTVAQAPWYIRMIRTLVLRERERPYVLVARVHGAGPAAVVWRHVLPAVLGQLVILATLDLGHVVLAVAGLSFLGLGAQPPDAEWGAMLNDGRITFVQQPLVMFVPGFCIFWTVCAANLVGDALRDVLDPGWPGRRP